MSMPVPDFTTFTDEDMDAFNFAFSTEQGRRSVRASTPAQIHQEVDRYHEAGGDLQALQDDVCAYIASLADSDG